MQVGKVLYSSLYWKCLQFASSFFLNILIARVLLSAVSAELYYLVYLFSGCISLFTLGLDIGFSYFLPTNALSPSTALRMMLSVIFFSLVICLPVLAMLYEPARFPDLQKGTVLFFAGCQIAGGLMTSLCGTLLTAYGKNDLQSKTVLGMNIVMGIFCVAGALIYRGSRLTGFVMSAWFILSFVQGMVLLALSIWRYGILRSRETDGERSPVHFREVLRFSFGAYIVNFIFFLGTRLGLYVLPSMISAAELGNYIQAYKLVEYLGLLTSFLYYPVISLVAGADVEKMKKNILLLVRISNTLVLLFSIVAMAVGWWAFPLVFGASFGDAFGIFICFIPGLFGVCSSAFFTAWYFGSGNIRINGISALIQLGAMAAGACLLPASKGTALAFSLASLLSLAYDLAIFRGFFRWTIRDIGLVRGSDLSVIRAFLRRRPGKIFFPQGQQGKI